MTDSPRIIRTGEWYDADALEANEDMAVVTTRVLLGLAATHCVLCGTEQPDDVRWPHYQMEVGKPDGLSVGDVDYCACPKCEARLDAILFAEAHR